MRNYAVHRLLLLIVIAMGAAQRGHSQTSVDLRTQSKSIDFGAAPSTRPTKTGTVLPATCSTGDLFFKTDAPAGQNLYGCAATNTWTPQAGGGGNYSAGTGIQILGTTIAVEDAVVPFYYTGTGAPAIACTAGRDIYTDTANNKRYYCGSGGTWRELSGATETSGAYKILPVEGLLWHSMMVEAVGLANRVYVHRFYLPFRITVNRILFQVTTGAPGNASVGIYSFDGNRLAMTGAVDVSVAGVKSVVLSPATTLSPGFYWYGFTCDSPTPVFRTVVNLEESQILNGSVVQNGFAANGATGGVVPDTLGVITDDFSRKLWLVKLQN